MRLAATLRFYRLKFRVRMRRLRLWSGFCQNCWRRAGQAYLCRRCAKDAIESGAFL